MLSSDVFFLFFVQAILEDRVLSSRDTGGGGGGVPPCDVEIHYLQSGGHASCRCGKGAGLIPLSVKRAASL